jgi:hypothetical protein
MQEISAIGKHDMKGNLLSHLILWNLCWVRNSDINLLNRSRVTRAATLMELCQLTTSFDASDHLTHPWFRPLVFPSKYDRQWVSSPQKVMLPTVMNRFAVARSRFLKISDCNVWSDDQRLYGFPDRPAHWQSKRIWMEQPEAGVWPEKCSDRSEGGEEKTKENWMICGATNTRINCFDRVRIGKGIAWRCIISQRRLWSSFRSGYSEKVDIWKSSNSVENHDGWLKISRSTIPVQLFDRVGIKMHSKKWYRKISWSKCGQKVRVSRFASNRSRRKTGEA